MRGCVLLAAVIVSAGAAAAGERRDLGAHEHGHSTLDVAVEGGRVTMALVSPGADIVGFEHAAETDGQKAEVERALAALADPIALFGPPAEAGCRVASATVGLEAEEGGSHTEFRAEYALDCAEPAALASLALAPFFARFPNAEEVEATLVTAQGQSSREVARTSPTLALDPGS